VAAERIRVAMGTVARLENLLCPSGSAKVKEAAARVEESFAGKSVPSIENLLRPLLTQVLYSQCLTADAVGEWETLGRKLCIPKFHFQRTAVTKDRIKVGVFAGIHGDEPAGILGLMDFVRELDEEPEYGRGFELFLYPLCNPTGYLAQTRESHSGKDLNREFWRESTEPEVIALEGEIKSCRFDGIIALHSDDTCHGFYGYARGSVLAKHLLAPALVAADQAQRRDARGIIDGFRAVDGIIHDAYDGILSAPPWQKPQPFEIILETPALTPIADQRRAFSLALRAILTGYREMIAFGGEL
jgi:murein peptide amidase A